MADLPFESGLPYAPEPELGYGPAGAIPYAMGGQPEPDMTMMMLDVDEVFGEFDGADWGTDDDSDHNANLANFIDKGQLDKLAQSIIEWVERDRQSRADWEWRETEGIRKLGLSRQDVQAVLNNAPKNAEWRSTATHPGLMKACIQFWARAYTELMPAGGPAKAIVLGSTTPEREAQARRVSGFENYLYTSEMPGAVAEFSQAMFRLPVSGSVFRKAWFDPVLGTLRVSFLESQDFIKPYSATDLGSAPRYTHVVRMTRNDLNRCIAMGYYRNFRRSEPDDESSEHTQLDYAIDAATGNSPVAGDNSHEAEYDNRDILYECSVMLDLADYDYEDQYGETWSDPDTGERVSIGVPYIVTVNKDAQETISIRRDWRETDAKKRRRRNVVEYKFLPGYGGYGYGLFHIAAGLSDAQTGLVRYLLDGCTLDTVGKLTGYVSQSAVGMNGLPPVRIGEFQRVPGNAEDWSKQIWSPEFKWSNNNSLEALQYLDQLLDVLVASTETMVGDENKNIPVGTILARIEQTSKPFAAIFSLLHASLGEELRAVADLAADYLPERYPYAVEGEDGEIFAADFDDRVDVIPVSDPNIVSATQRMAQAQVIQEQSTALFQMNPSPETWQVVMQAYQHLLEVMRVPNVERFMPPAPQRSQPEQPPPVDPDAAKIEREDAVAAAKINREDALAQAKIDREAKQMEINSQARQAGDMAIQTEEQDQDLIRMQQEILQAAQARRQQMAEQAGREVMA